MSLIETFDHLSAVVLLRSLKRGVHAYSCIMGNQGKMAENSTICIRIQGQLRFVMGSTSGKQQQNLGLGLTIIRPVLERIQGFLLRIETRMIFCIDIFLARDIVFLRMLLYT